MANLAARLLDIAGFSSVGQVMRIRNFRIYLMGHIPNVVGVWVVRIAIGWLAWDLTHSEFWTGALAAADAMPVILLGPIGGALADRLDRRTIAMIAQIVLTVISVVLAVLTYLGLIEIYSLFALALLRGITFAFWQPVRLAMMPNLVPRADMPTAIALNSSSFNAAYFVGPAIGAGLMSIGGPALAFLFNSLAAGMMVWALALVRLPARPPRTGGGPGFVADMLEGVRYGFRHPGIAPMLLLLVALGVMIRPLTEQLPPVADTVFHLGEGGFYTMVSTVGLGAMVGAIWMLRRGNRGGITTVALAAGLVGGLAAFLVVTLASFPLALACLAILGFTMTSGGIATQQAVQLAVPDEVRGRVLSLFGMIFRGAPATGALIMGVIAERIGIAAPVAAGALVGVAVYAMAFARRRRLTSLLEGGPPETGSADDDPGAPANVEPGETGKR